MMTANNNDNDTRTAALERLRAIRAKFEASITPADPVEIERMEFPKAVAPRPAKAESNRVQDIEAAIAAGDLVAPTDPEWAVKVSRLSGMDEADITRKHTYRVIMTCLARSTMTANEIADYTGISVNTIRPRLTELKQERRVEPTGERRPTGNGSCTAAAMRIRYSR